jgi:hypothetical protein
MSKRLDKVKLVKDEKGFFKRMDPIENIGVSTFVLIKDAIEESKFQLAKDLVDYLFIPEVKLVHDAHGDWMLGWPSFLARNYGEDVISEAYEFVFRYGWANPLATMKPEFHKRGSAEERLILTYALRTWTGHRMGTYDGRDGFTVKDYEDRLELDWDPCASGGRGLRGDQMAGTPGRLEEPYNQWATTVPHKWSWGLTGVSGYCVHCCIIHAQWEVDKYGYLRFVQIPPTKDNPNRPCTWVAYKDEDDTPEEYYTMVGRVKPKRTSPPHKFSNPPKLLGVKHSTDWQGYPYNMIKDACDKGDKEGALKALQNLRFITARLAGMNSRWHWSWMDWVFNHYGYDELFHAIRTVDYSYRPVKAPGTPKPTKDTIPSAEERARTAALWGRSDRSGPDHEGSVNMIDEPDRIVMELKPCGSGGLMRLGDPEFDRPPATEPPNSLKVTSQPLNMSWGKKGVPHFCMRCCVQEELRGIIDNGGYLTTVVEWPDDPKDPCRWFFYKDLDKIPEKYYTRIGAKKPPVQAKAKAKK